MSDESCRKNRGHVVLADDALAFYLLITRSHRRLQRHNAHAPLHPQCQRPPRPPGSAARSAGCADSNHEHAAGGAATLTESQWTMRCGSSSGCTPLLLLPRQSPQPSHRHLLCPDQDNNPSPLEGRTFAVLGLGNRQYEHFNLICLPTTSCSNALFSLPIPLALCVCARVQMGKMLDKHLAVLVCELSHTVGTPLRVIPPMLARMKHCRWRQPCGHTVFARLLIQHCASHHDMPEMHAHAMRNRIFQPSAYATLSSDVDIVSSAACPFLIATWVPPPRLTEAIDGNFGLASCKLSQQ
ncbi:unnamed protein product [Closterium sp. Naga37s-1]|nr:unnamed protein product [Closterium sp. Naga37s-1]